ncbi:hypothetical protein BH24PSE2_BH24PSE2_02830 [soil metagenome]
MACRLAALILAMLPAVSVSAVEMLHLDTTRKGGIYVLDAEVRIDAPLSAVRAVILDFEHLAQLSERVEESRVLEREPNGTLVFTRVDGCIAVVCREVERVERVVDFSMNHIEATVLPEHSNVKYGKTVWMLHEEEDDATRLEYHMAFQPGFWVPPLVGRMAVQRSMRAEASKMFERLEELAARVVIDRP